MANFVDIHGKPVTRLDLAVGETAIVAIKKFNLAPLVEVGVVTRDSSIAFSHQCVHLGDRTKKKYIDVYDMAIVSAGNVPVESQGKFYYQICGRNPGDTMLDAFYWVSQDHRMGAPYAPSIEISIKPNPKLLVPPARPGEIVEGFDAMWRNHPMNPANGPTDYPCNNGKAPLHHMQCFVRLCEALYKSGVSFKGCYGTSCRLKGHDHAHHFSNPYEFPGWTWAKRKAYVWEARYPYSPEPMPGLAAFEFMKGRQGIVLFTNYFDVKGHSSMWGGHIDLWNKNRMGNTYSDKYPEEGEAAFLRSRKISFWPLVADAPR